MQCFLNLRASPVRGNRKTGRDVLRLFDPQVIRCGWVTRVQQASQFLQLFQAIDLKHVSHPDFTHACGMDSHLQDGFAHAG